jgi:nucleoside-triphosphatase
MYLSPRGRADLTAIWLITGSPGIGKSTAVSKVLMRLKSAGVIVGGCTTSEKRSGGTRTGFEIRDLSSGRTGELASAASKIGPRVGRYRVNLEDLAKVGGAGLEAASSSSELIVVDEVGPMELVSPEFRKGVRLCIDSGRPLLAVVHERLEDDLLRELREKAAAIFTLTVENRDEAADELAGALLEAVGGPKV